jgi:hypothetical protein
MLEHAEMTGRRRPRALETGRDLTGGHGAAPMVQDEQDLASRRVRQRGKDGFDVVELALARWLGRARCGQRVDSAIGS